MCALVGALAGVLVVDIAAQDAVQARAFKAAIAHLLVAVMLPWALLLLMSRWLHRHSQAQSS